MNEPSRVQRLLGRTGGFAVVFALSVGLFYAYRWADTPRNPLLPNPNRPPSRVGIRLENAPFTGYSQGHKTWSLNAGQIDLERPSESAIANFQSATLTDIREGKLYPPAPEVTNTTPDAALTLPGITPRPQPNSVAKAVPAPPDDKALPTATFRAQHGYYSLGGSEPTPPEISLNYFVQWQFKLQGDVVLQTQAGDRLQAESLTILEMIGRNSRRLERRILCDAGARVTLKNVQMQANQARYDPKERSLECLGGVRGTFKEGTLQAERLFWSLKDQILRCPEPATGVMQGVPFSAENVTIDLKRRRLHANRARLQFRIEDETLLKGR